MATHSSILPWKIPWTEKPGELQSMGSQRVEHNWARMRARTHTHIPGEGSGFSLVLQCWIRLAPCHPCSLIASISLSFSTVRNLQLSLKSSDSRTFLPQFLFLSLPGMLSLPQAEWPAPVQTLACSCLLQRNLPEPTNLVKLPLS